MLLYVNISMTINDAKKLFFMCNGNMFAIEREDKYKEFKDLHISNTLIAQWKQELRQHYESIINIKYTPSIVMDAIYKYSELDFIDDKSYIWNYFVTEKYNLDDFSKLLLCEVFCSKCCDAWIENNEKDILESELKELRIKNEEKCFYIDESYKTAFFLSEEDFTPENLKERIENALTTLRSFRGQAQEKREKKNFWRCLLRKKR